MSVNLDPREVLAILNEKGYRNISAAQLKEFMKDLKKLIKYEERYGPPELFDQQSEATSSKNVPTLFDKLYAASTVASRAKAAHPLPRVQSPPRRAPSKEAMVSSPVTSTPKKSNTPPLNVSHQFGHSSAIELTRPERPSTQQQRTDVKRQLLMDNFRHMNEKEVRNVLVMENRQINEKDKIRTKQIELEDKDKMPAQTLKSNKPDNERPTSATLYRASQADQRRYIIRNTPTDLYQYYQDNWERFKNNFPGENAHAGLRQSIRKKMEMIQKDQRQPRVVVCIQPEHRKQIKRIY